MAAHVQYLFQPDPLARFARLAADTREYAVRGGATVRGGELLYKAAYYVRERAGALGSVQIITAPSPNGSWSFWHGRDLYLVLSGHTPEHYTQALEQMGQGIWYNDDQTPTRDLAPRAGRLFRAILTTGVVVA